MAYSAKTNIRLKLYTQGLIMIHAHNLYKTENLHYGVVEKDEVRIIQYLLLC